MALFAITRYKGEEEKEQSSPSSGDILKRIHEQAELRRKQLQSRSESKRGKRQLKLGDSTPENEEGSSRKRRKNNRLSRETNDHIDVESPAIRTSVAKKHRKEKKKREENDGIDSNSNELSENDTSLIPDKDKHDSSPESNYKQKIRKKEKISDNPNSSKKSEVSTPKSWKESKNSEIPSVIVSGEYSGQDRSSDKDLKRKTTKSKKHSKLYVDIPGNRIDPSTTKSDVNSGLGGEGYSSSDGSNSTIESDSNVQESSSESESSSEEEGGSNSADSDEEPEAAVEEIEHDSKDVVGDEDGEALLEDGEHAEEVEENEYEKHREGEQQSHQEIGGFTVIGDVQPKFVPKVARVLPNWLANPSVFSSDLDREEGLLSDIHGLDQDLLYKLKENGIRKFFPVQKQVIPVLLDVNQSGLLRGKVGFRPHDVCCSAPTGSGKTLAFVLPIVQMLKTRVVCHVRALAVLPVRELATQVYKVFLTYSHGTSLKVKLVAGQQAFNKEQEQLVKKGPRGHQSQADIIVATPGRLVDHLNLTPGFSLQHLRYLVIDEADRVMEEIKQDWLTQVEKAVYNTPHQGAAGISEPDSKGKLSRRLHPGPNTAASAAHMSTPLQKLLFSATLSRNPEKLDQLSLFQPKLFTSGVTSNKCGGRDTSRGDTGTDARISGAMEGKVMSRYTTPVGLKEMFVACSVARKPLVILHFLHDLKYRHVLCFTNSRESTHRLYWLIKLIGGIEVREFSARLSQEKRKNMLRKFAVGKIDLLICSDAMARGMDIENVEYVISYEPPSHLTTYIHRVGRCARAGKAGTALTLLEPKQIRHFRIMTLEAGKSGALAVKEKKLSYRPHLLPHLPKMEAALSEMPSILKAEDRRKSVNK